MSRKKLLFSVLASLATLSIIATVSSQGDTNAVLKFYWHNAGAALANLDPMKNGAKFSFVATTYYKRTESTGRVTSVDSMQSKYYYSFATLDSVRELIPPKHRLPDLDLSFPDIFDSTYALEFFPNDTGGPLLSIGFDTRGQDDPRPVGVATIDRNRYVLHMLHLSYAQKSGFRRFSRSFRFQQTEGVIFPDSVWEVAAKDQLLFTTYYRLETRITDLHVTH